MHKFLVSMPWHWLPPLTVLALVLTLHIDVPYHDQWDLLPLLHAWYEGQLHWAMLLVPHNGHLLLLPQAVMLALAISTQWNTLAEVLFGYLCMLGCWRLLEQMAATLLCRALTLMERTVLSLLVFSLSQAQNWLWGWQLQIPLALLFLLAGYQSLLSLRHDSLAVSSAAVCGLAATCSFGGSLPYWIAVLPLLWQRQRWLVLPWSCVAGACLWWYAGLIGMREPLTAAPDNPMPFSECWRHIGNTLVLLGNLVARYDRLAAMIAGTAALLISGLAFGNLPARQAHCLLSLLLFCVGSAVLVSLSRAGMGDEQMLASRYGTLTLPCWMLTAMMLTERINNSRPNHWHLAGWLLLVSLLANDIYSLQDFEQLHRRLQRGAHAMAQIDTPAGAQQLPVINPRADRQQAIAEVHLLQQYRLSYFRQQAPQQAFEFFRRHRTLHDVIE